MREGESRRPGREEAKLQKFTPGALGERDWRGVRMGLALASLGSWERVEGRLSAAGSRRPRGHRWSPVGSAPLSLSCWSQMLKRSWRSGAGTASTAAWKNWGCCCWSTDPGPDSSSAITPPLSSISVTRVPGLPTWVGTFDALETLAPRDLGIQPSPFPLSERDLHRNP